jgi:hypothetical protein
MLRSWGGARGGVADFGSGGWNRAEQGRSWSMGATTGACPAEPHSGMAGGRGGRTRGKGRTAAVAPGGRARGLAQDLAREGGARLRRPQPKVTDGSYPASQRGEEGSSRHVGEAGILAKRAKRARGSGTSPTRSIQAGEGWLPPVRDAEARFPSGSAACTASLAAQGVGDSAEDSGLRDWESCTGPAVSGNLPDSEDRVREQQA